jgi:D-threo-aldose 1-dehydrogenase
VDALPDLLPHCARAGVAVLLAAPFNSGTLATGATPGARYFYEPASREILARTRRLEAVCGRHGVPLAAAALQFPLAHPAVASVVAGARSCRRARRCPSRSQPPGLMLWFKWKALSGSYWAFTRASRA